MMTFKLKVKGLHCEACARGLRQAFKDVKDTELLEVDLEKQIVVLQGKKNQEEQWKEIIEDLGFDYLGFDK